MVQCVVVFCNLSQCFVVRCTNSQNSSIVECAVKSDSCTDVWKNLPQMEDKKSKKNDDIVMRPMTPSDYEVRTCVAVCCSVLQCVAVVYGCAARDVC